MWDACDGRFSVVAVAVVTRGLVAASVMVAVTGCLETVEAPLLIVGHLVGNPDTGCVGVTVEPHTAYPQDAGVHWPEGIQPRVDPVRLMDQQGKVIAREGDLLHLGGHVTEHLSPQPPCRNRPSFVVKEIMQVVPADG